jgi:hypothetical protein
MLHLALLLILCLAWTQTTFLCHNHDSASDHCAICHAGKLPLAGPSPAVAPAPRVAVEWQKAVERVTPPRPDAQFAKPPRAPPV